jgi:thiosulfate/3-mercaptopyruvate sulfurtransferase
MEYTMSESSERSGPVIEVDELARSLARGDTLVVADCRFDLASPQAGEDAWRADHIPGSHYLHLERDLSAPRSSVGGRHPVPEAEAFTALMRGIGVDTDTLLVACDEGSHAYAARLWWLARYFGHLRVAVLNGGIAAWSRAGHPLDAEPVARGSGNFSARIDHGMRLDYEAVRDGRSGMTLVDARDARRFEGIEDLVDPRAGHIPGAIDMPWQGALGAQGLLGDAAAQRARWQWLQATGKQPVMYCGSGITACVNLLSLELAGIHVAKLYPGSWSDWCQHDGEVATGKSFP